MTFDTHKKHHTQVNMKGICTHSPATLLLTSTEEVHHTATGKITRCSKTTKHDRDGRLHHLLLFVSSAFTNISARSPAAFIATTSH